MPVTYAGLSSAGADAFIDAAEYKDFGTSRYPWSAPHKATIKAALQNLGDTKALKVEVNKQVVTLKGGGISGRGPLK